MGLKEHRSCMWLFWVERLFGVTILLLFCCSVAQLFSTLCETMDITFTISWRLLKLMSTEWVMPSIRPRQMRSIFIQGEPELSLPAVLPAVLTALPLAPASSSLQCPPWGPDQGEEGQKGGNWAPLYFTSATWTWSTLFSPLYFRQFLGLYIWTLSPTGALGLSGPERIYFGLLANRKLVRTWSACLETTNTRIDWAPLGLNTAVNKTDENSYPHRAWLLMGSSR